MAKCHQIFTEKGYSVAAAQANLLGRAEQGSLCIWTQGISWSTCTEESKAPERDTHYLSETLFTHLHSSFLLTGLFCYLVHAVEDGYLHLPRLLGNFPVNKETFSLNQSQISQWENLIGQFTSGFFTSSSKLHPEDNTKWPEEVYQVTWALGQFQ